MIRSKAALGASSPAFIKHLSLMRPVLAALVLLVSKISVPLSFSPFLSHHPQISKGFRVCNFATPALFARSTPISTQLESITTRFKRSAHALLLPHLIRRLESIAAASTTARKVESIAAFSVRSTVASYPARQLVSVAVLMREPKEDYQVSHRCPLSGAPHQQANDGFRDGSRIRGSRNAG